MREFFPKKTLASRLIGFALGSLLLAQTAQSDLGALVARGDLGEDRITVLAAPSPLRVGRISLSVSLQPARKSSHSRTTEVDLTFHPPAGHPVGDAHHHAAAIQTQASEEQSTHPGMLGATIELHQAGTWRVEVKSPQSGKEGVFFFDLEVGPPASPWIDYGVAFALPIVGILIFIWHQRRSLAGKRPDPN